MRTFKFFAMAVLAATSILFVSCDDKKPATDPADKTALNALITECQTLADAATPALYPQTAIDAFNTAIATANAVKNDESVTQEAVDNTVLNLTNAKTVFLESAYGHIPDNALVLGMDFENITGNSFVAQGFRNLTVLLSEDSVTTTLPTVVTGHNGKGLFFENAAHLSVPNYTATDFEGSTLSIAVWLKPAETKAGNYIVSYNKWESFKFQIQDENKPFFTVHTATDGWCDADNESPQTVPENTWTHVVVSMDITTAGQEFLRIYINGQLTKEWDAVTRPGLAASTVMPNSDGKPLFIGIREIGSAFTNSTETNDFFHGTMDELKIYNIALTDGQVSGLYNSENTGN
jgi:hypothetical protein